MKSAKLLFTLILAFVFAVAVPAMAENNNTLQETETAATDTSANAPLDSTAQAAADSIQKVKADSLAKVEAEEKKAEAAAAAAAKADEPVAPKQSLHKVIMEKFIQGGVTFMTPVLLCLILGLAVSIERIISLNLSATNTGKFLKNIEHALDTGGVAAATEYAKSKRGSVPAIISQGLMRTDEGIEQVEKAIVSYGSVEMGKLEKGLVWLSLFIALAPMLGFMGTVIGMIQAFDTIQQSGEMDPTQMAGGIKVALITTVSGLIVAVILQVFYNYCVSKVDSITNSMEDASISFVDMMIHKGIGRPKV